MGAEKFLLLAVTTLRLSQEICNARLEQKVVSLHFCSVISKQHG